jgi:hypothetical protein
LFGGVSKAGEIGTLPKTSLPVPVLRVAKAKKQQWLGLVFAKFMRQIEWNKLHKACESKSQKVHLHSLLHV